MREGRLPEDWKHSPLGELGEITTGSTPPTSMPKNYGGKIPFVGPGDLGDFRSVTLSSKKITEFGASQSRTVGPNTVFVSCIGILGKTGQAKHRMAFNQQINAISPYPSKVDPKFLYYLCDTLGTTLEKLAGLQVIPIVNKREFSTITRPVPCSIPEQQKIAQILDTLDTQIQKTEALIAKLEKIKDGLLHDLLTRGIDQNGQLRPTPEQAPELYMESALGLIPKEWQIYPAETVCEAVVDCKNRTPPERDVGYPVIRTPNVRNGRFVYSNLLFTDLKSYEIWTQRGAPRAGDIVITREAPVGEVCKIPSTMSKACLGQRMMMYQPDPNKILTDFMLAALVSRRVQGRLLDLAGGSTVGHVRVGDIRRLAIPTPPIKEQSVIAQSFNSIESRLNKEVHELEKLCLQKSGLMDDLLTGRVRVTPLLKDEA